MEMFKGNSFKDILMKELFESNLIKFYGNVLETVYRIEIHFNDSNKCFVNVLVKFSYLYIFFNSISLECIVSLYEKLKELDNNN